MGRIKDWWVALDERPSNRIGLVINIVTVVVMLAGFIWGVWWAIAQGKKADARAIVVDARAIVVDARAIAQEEKVDARATVVDARAIAQEEKVDARATVVDARAIAQEEKADARATTHEEKDDERLVTFRDLVAQLEKFHKTNIEDLTKKYDKIASKVEKRANSFAKKSDEMSLGETTRMIIAGQENTERALKDVYEKAVKEAEKRNYIFELNQAPDGDGSGLFMTEYDDKSGRSQEQANGNSYLLNYEERKTIRDCLRSQIANGKSEGQKGKIVDRSEQERLFRFLLQHDGSNIGCMTEPLNRQFKQPTMYGKNIDVNMSPPEKIGAIIGYIGDLMYPEFCTPKG